MDGDGDLGEGPPPPQEGSSRDQPTAEVDPASDGGLDVEPLDSLSPSRVSFDAMDPLKGFRAHLAATDPLKGYRAQFAGVDPLKGFRAQLAATDPLKGYRAQFAGVDPLKGFRAQLATSWVAPLNARSVSARISRSVAGELLASPDPRRRARVVDQQFVSGLVSDFAESAPDLDTPEILAEALTRGTDPIPLAQDSLLSDEEVVVESWIASILANFMTASGLSERDLLEDSVAAIAYTATMAMAVAILVNYPALLVILAPTGIAGKDPAAYMSRLARRGFRRMNES